MSATPVYDLVVEAEEGFDLLDTEVDSLREIKASRAAHTDFDWDLVNDYHNERAKYYETAKFDQWTAFQIARRYTRERKNLNRGIAP